MTWRSAAQVPICPPRHLERDGALTNVTAPRDGAESPADQRRAAVAGSVKAVCGSRYVGSDRGPARRGGGTPAPSRPGDRQGIVAVRLLGQ